MSNTKKNNFMQDAEEKPDNIPLSPVQHISYEADDIDSLGRGIAAIETYS